MKQIDEKRFLKRRLVEANKSTYGKMIIVGGSLAYPGSILLASEAALTTGVGYVALGIKRDIYPVVATRIKEVIYQVFDSFKDEASLAKLLKYDTIVFGNGFVDEDSAYALSYLLKYFEGNLVIDASGLDTLKEVGLNQLLKTKAQVILTPHYGEFTRLFDIEEKIELPKRVGVLKELASKYHVTIDLKDYISFVSDGFHFMTLKNGSCGLAKAGSGDMLAGLIGGFITHIKKDPLAVTYFAHFIMNQASLELENEISTHSFTSSKVISKIPEVIKKYEY